jgi:hypothetical protein
VGGIPDEVLSFDGGRIKHIWGKSGANLVQKKNPQLDFEQVADCFCSP